MVERDWGGGTVSAIRDWACYHLVIFMPGRLFRAGFGLSLVPYAGRWANRHAITPARAQTGRVG